MTSEYPKRVSWFFTREGLSFVAWFFVMCLISWIALCVGVALLYGLIWLLGGA